MAERPLIEIFREKKALDFTEALSDPDCRAMTGSAAALTAAQAAALAQRAARMSFAADTQSEEEAYLLRNLDILRGYMVNLIDEDVKSRGPLRRAFKEQDSQAIEASRHTATAINAEIINMMDKLFEFDDRLCDLCKEESLHFIAESAELAWCACRVARSGIFAQAKPCTDETFVYVTRRENEITFTDYQERYNRIISKATVQL